MRPEPADTESAVAVLADVLRVPGIDYVVRSWRDDRFGAVNLLNGICANLDQPVRTDEDVLFLDGEISNIRELWASTAQTAPETFPGPARACLDLYAQMGSDLVGRLNGQFNVLLYDHRGHSVRVYNDRLAYRPLYYLCSEGLALFGLEKKAIFAVMGRTPSVDAMGLLEFMTFGHNLDDRTVFSGVRVMPPGAVLELKDGRATIERYWRPRYAGQNRTGSLGEDAREFGRRLCRAVERRTEDGRRNGIFLSGGLDSRATAGALARVGHDVASFTFGRDDSPDLKYGKQLAAKLGFTHHRLLYDDVSFADYLPRVVWRTEASIPFHQTLSIVHHRGIRAQADVIFNGHFGDALTGGHLLPGQFLIRNVQGLAQHILSKRSMMPFLGVRALFRPSFVNEAYPEMVEGIERFLHSLGEHRLPLAYNLWDMQVRQPRFTFSAPAVDRYIVEQVTPFTDNDVVDWMLGTPVQHLFLQRAYKRMLVSTFPEIGDVPWARTGRPVPTNDAIDIAVQGWLFVAKRLRRTGKEVQPSTMDPRLRSMEPYVTGDIMMDTLPGDLFDRDAVRRVARDALNGEASPTPLFLASTLAECFRLFGSTGLTTPPVQTAPIL